MQKSAAQTIKVAGADTEYLTLLKSYTSVTEGDVGSLHLPTELFQQFMEECCIAFHVHAMSIFFEDHICDRLVPCMLDSPKAKEILANLCHPKFLTTMTRTYTRMELYKLCFRVSQQNAPQSAAEHPQSRKLQKLRHC